MPVAGEIVRIVKDMRARALPLKKVIIDTTGLTGTYFLYTTNLQNLSNDDENFGGMMTEIRISAT
jgi:hypothetical protein